MLSQLKRAWERRKDAAALDAEANMAQLRQRWDDLGDTLRHLTWPPVEQVAKLCAAVLLVGAVVLAAMSLFDELCASLVFVLLPQLRSGSA